MAMSGQLIQRALWKKLAQVRYVSVVQPVQARGVVAAVYAHIERDYGTIAAPIAVHSPAPPLLAASWVLLRETMVATGLVDRPAKEAIATAVSLGNACSYGVDLHLTTLELLNERRDAAIGTDNAAAARADHAIRGISEWARAAGSRQAAASTGPPVPADQVTELVATVVAAHYLNRMATVFLPESQLPDGLPPSARGAALRLFGRCVLLAACRTQRPGISLDLLPDAPLPDDLAWAKDNPTIARAFARSAAAIDKAGTRCLSPAIRGLVRQELAAWQGDSSDFDRDWLNRTVSSLPVAERPAGHLALLTALAPHQLDSSVVRRLRRLGATERTLVEVTSWASMAAARQVGSWIPASRPADRLAQVIPFRRAPRDAAVGLTLR
jgi:alkylhydroperoxidase family enzyme